MSTEIDHGMLFNFIMFCAISWGILSIIFIKPHRLFKKLVVRLFSIQVLIKGNLMHLYHFILFVVMFFGILFAFLQMQKSTFIPEDHDSHETKLGKLDKKWNIEMMIWLCTIILISLISIYRNAMLFSEEERVKTELNLLIKESNQKAQ